MRKFFQLFLISTCNLSLSYGMDNDLTELQKMHQQIQKMQQQMQSMQEYIQQQTKTNENFKISELSEKISELLKKITCSFEWQNGQGGSKGAGTGFLLSQLIKGIDLTWMPKNSALFVTNNHCGGWNESRIHTNHIIKTSWNQTYNNLTLLIASNECDIAIWLVKNMDANDLDFQYAISDQVAQMSETLYVMSNSGNQGLRPSSGPVIEKNTLYTTFGCNTATTTINLTDGNNQTGGCSGSPVLDQKGNLLGVINSGNLHRLNFIRSCYLIEMLNHLSQKQSLNKSQFDYFPIKCSGLFTDFVIGPIDTIGDQYQIDPEYFKYGEGEPRNGILVKWTVPCYKNPLESLKPGDVLYEITEESTIKTQNNEFVQIQNNKRIKSDFYLIQKAIDNALNEQKNYIDLRVIRNGTPQWIKLPVTQYLPNNPKIIEWGGACFSMQHYLVGNEYKQVLICAPQHSFHGQNKSSCSSIFGKDSFVIDAVNGNKVQNLKDLLTAFDSCLNTDFGIIYRNFDSIKKFLVGSKQSFKIIPNHGNPNNPNQFVFGLNGQWYKQK